MPNDNQGTLVQTVGRSGRRSCSPNACGIVRHSTLWLRPEAVAQIEFLEWTVEGRLRHSKFVGLREDKNPRSVVKEQAGTA
jgi:ATP-dependent DNA ligase